MGKMLEAACMMSVHATDDTGHVTLCLSLSSLLSYGCSGDLDVEVGESARMPHVVPVG